MVARNILQRMLTQSKTNDRMTSTTTTATITIFGEVLSVVVLRLNLNGFVWHAVRASVGDQ